MLLVWMIDEQFYLMAYTIGLYTALALANKDPQMVKRGVILAVSKMPE